MGVAIVLHVLLLIGVAIPQTPTDPVQDQVSLAKFNLTSSAPFSNALANNTELATPFPATTLREILEFDTGNNTGLNATVIVESKQGPLLNTSVSTTSALFFWDLAPCSNGLQDKGEKIWTSIKLLENTTDIVPVKLSRVYQNALLPTNITQWIILQNRSTNYYAVDVIVPARSVTLQLDIRCHVENKASPFKLFNKLTLVTGNHCFKDNTQDGQEIFIIPTGNNTNLTHVFATPFVTNTRVYFSLDVHPEFYANLTNHVYSISATLIQKPPVDMTLMWILCWSVAGGFLFVVFLITCVCWVRGRKVNENYKKN